jgi:D-alanyl-D-alanine carboxypeptidase
LTSLPVPADWIARRGLPRCEEARTLVTVGRSAEGREFQLEPQAAQAWLALQAAAAADGIALVLESAFRSVARQTEILQAKLDGGQTLEETLTLVAPPGYSEHHTGRAVDIGTPGSVALEEDFETTAAFAWLRVHARQHGFTMSYPRGNAQGYAYEPWHWCFNGCFTQPAAD